MRQDALRAAAPTTCIAGRTDGNGTGREAAGGATTAAARGGGASAVGCRERGARRSWGGAGKCGPGGMGGIAERRSDRRHYYGRDAAGQAAASWQVSQGRLGGRWQGHARLRRSQTD